MDGGRCCTQGGLLLSVRRLDPTAQSTIDESLACRFSSHRHVLKSLLGRAGTSKARSFESTGCTRSQHWSRLHQRRPVRECLRCCTCTVEGRPSLRTISAGRGEDTPSCPSTATERASGGKQAPLLCTLSRCRRATTRCFPPALSVACFNHCERPNGLDG